MKIAFLDHPYHRQTKSSHFFSELLAPLGSVSFFYPGADWRLIVEEIILGNFDLAICWQHEFYAPALRAAGIRVIAVPMYDGSGGLSDVYWREFSQIPLINFSTNLHHRLTNLGLNSTLVRYFPEVPANICSSFEQLRAFVWMRNNLAGWRLLKLLTGRQLRSIHLHIAPDDATPARFPAIRELDELHDAFSEVTLSKWFEKKSDFRTAILGCNVFLAPRLAEGIGLPVLEAMSHGMCVISHSMPTMNEYIIKGGNGILCDYHNPERISLARAGELGLNARNTIIQGRPKWENDQYEVARLVERVISRPPPNLSKAERAHFSTFPERYWRGALR